MYGIINIRRAWESCLYNGNLYTGQTASLYWDCPQDLLELFNKHINQSDSDILTQIIAFMLVRRYDSNFKSIIFKLIIENNSLDNHCEIVLMWIP